MGRHRRLHGTGPGQGGVPQARRRQPGGNRVQGRGYEGAAALGGWTGRKTKNRWQYRDEVPVFAGYKDLPPAGYRPSLEMVRVKESLAWDRRVPVTRPGSWHGDPWLGDRTDEGWDAIELSKLPAVVGGRR
jgi:hypothetical protein